MKPSGWVTDNPNRTTVFTRLSSLKKIGTALKRNFAARTSSERLSAESLRTVLAQVKSFASLNAASLMCGEPETGKESITRSNHKLSHPRHGLERKHLGDDKGRSTRRMARLDFAHKGTLYKEKIGDLPLAFEPMFRCSQQQCRMVNIGGTRWMVPSSSPGFVSQTVRHSAHLIAARSDEIVKLAIDRFERGVLLRRTGQGFEQHVLAFQRGLQVRRKMPRFRVANASINVHFTIPGKDKPDLVTISNRATGRKGIYGYH